MGLDPLAEARGDNGEREERRQDNAEGSGPDRGAAYDSACANW